MNWWNTCTEAGIQWVILLIGTNIVNPFIFALLKKIPNPWRADAQTALANLVMASLKMPDAEWSPSKILINTHEIETDDYLVTFTLRTTIAQGGGGVTISPCNLLVRVHATSEAVENLLYDNHKQEILTRANAIKTKTEKERRRIDNVNEAKQKRDAALKLVGKLTPSKS